MFDQSSTAEPLTDKRTWPGAAGRTGCRNIWLPGSLRYIMTTLQGCQPADVLQNGQQRLRRPAEGGPKAAGWYCVLAWHGGLPPALCHCCSPWNSLGCATPDLSAQCYDGKDAPQ